MNFFFIIICSGHLTNVKIVAFICLDSTELTCLPKVAETIPEDSSRVLLAGLPAVKGLLNKMRDLDQRKGDDNLDLSIPAEHILYIYRSLKWCHDNYHNLMENVPSRAIAGDDCYGRGENKK